ncbi:MAG: rane protein [Sphingobacteriales bacterium]|nr:rane protein [Sphingobacteriales bacterium]
MNSSPDFKLRNTISSPVYTKQVKAKVNPLIQAQLQLKKGIWLYFLLLIFEGALRKWFLTGLSTPLLLIRDPLALWLIFKGIENGILKVNAYLVIIPLIGIIGIYTAFFLGHGNIFVAIYGARVLLLQIPLIFLIGQVFNRDDVLKVGKATLWIALPMTLIIALQFYSPQSAWINQGVGGDVKGAGFDGALNFFRPPGTFSFTNGTTLFYGFAAPFIVYFWIEPSTIRRLLLIGATACLLVSIPLSISRSLLVHVGITIAFAIIGISFKPKYLKQLVVAFFAVFVVFVLVSDTQFFKTATHAFEVRLETANEQEGGMQKILGGRFLGGMIGAVTESSSLPFFGYGLGMGTNVGSMLLNGNVTYLISEGEWGRVIGELGPLLGLLIILLRLNLCIQLITKCIKKLFVGDLLPWILVSFSVLLTAQGGWAQPTSLGFCVIVAGLTLASLKR